MWYLSLSGQKVQMWKPYCNCIFFHVGVLLATVTNLGKVINIVLLESWELQPWKAKSKPLSLTALVWCVVLLLWRHMTNDEIRSKQRDKLLATEMMGKRLLCQEEKLKFLSSGKEIKEYLARVSVPSTNISPTIAAPGIRINPDKAPWSSLPFSIGFMNWKHMICDRIEGLNSFSQTYWKQKHLGPAVSQEHCGVVCYPHRMRKAIPYSALAVGCPGCIVTPLQHSQSLPAQSLPCLLPVLLHNIPACLVNIMD